jgi:DNA (cytosine-5)-methyltransferase 1
LNIVAVDLFAGAGGFSTGAELAGVHVAVAANHWPVAVDVHARNHPDTTHHCQDLRQFDFSALPAFDLLLASPSCQGHSRAGRPARARSAATAKTHDIYRATAWAVIDCLEVCRPRAAIVENVPEFLAWPLYPEWVACLRKLGYAVSEQVLTASRWGVPQRRQRAVITAITEETPIAVQDPATDETSAVDIFDERADGWRAISSIRESATRLPGHARRTSSRERATTSNDRAMGQLAWGQHVNAPSLWGRLPSAGPINTLTTQCASQLFWTRDGEYRLWTRRELLRAMSFPDTYDLGNVSKEATGILIGNAIPPKLASGVVSRVVAALTETA